MSNWEKRESTSHPSREYYLNTNTQVSQWGIPEGEIPLPPDWERHRSRQFNKIYYENVKTTQTQWEPPFGRILPFILFGDDPDPYYVLDNLDSNWKYGIFITPIFTDEEVYIKKLIHDPYPWGELHIACSQFISINSEKAKLCLQKIMSIVNPKVNIDVRHYFKADYKPSPIENSLFDYFSDNFIVGNKYGIIVDSIAKEIYEYLGREDCKTLEKNESAETEIYFDGEEIPKYWNIKDGECHIFKDKYGDNLKISVSDARKLGRFKTYIPPIDYSSGLSNIDKEDIKKIEQSSIRTLKKLFVETYYNLSEKQSEFFSRYSASITSFIFRLTYTNRNGNTFIDDDSAITKFHINKKLLLDLHTSPKAESDFYVFRGSAHSDPKILSGEATEQKSYGPISTTILSSYSNKKLLKINQCCIFLIRVPRNENYLILHTVFTKTNDKLELNNESEYEVTLAPGKIIFKNMKKITIDGDERVLFVCDYKSFTEEEFNAGFYRQMYEYDPTRKMRKIDLEKEDEDRILKRRSQEERNFLNYEKILDKNMDYEYANDALKELKKIEWEYSFVACLDDNENDTRSLIFISKTLGIRTYVRNSNLLTRVK